MTIPRKLSSANLVTVAIIVAGLFLTREILVPIALAVLLTFVVKALQRWHFPRTLAVICAVLAALVVALSLAAIVVFQVNQLSADLPRYQVTLGEKVHAVRDRVASAGLLLNASNLLKNLGKELDESERTGIQPPSSLSSSTSSAKPVPVQIRQPEPGASETPESKPAGRNVAIQVR